MISGARSLFGLATVTVVFALLTAILTAPGASGDQVLTHVVGLLRVSVLAGHWWELTQFALAVAILVGTLSVSEKVLGRERKVQATKFSASLAQNLQEHLTEARQRVESCLLTETPDVIAAFDELVRGGAVVMASDIHLSPTVSHFKITYRVHGTLRDVCELPLAFAPRLTSRAKVLAEMDTHVHGTPQDGRLVVELDGTRIDARVSCLPTEFGERVVMRLVSGSRTVPELEGLGFTAEVQRGLTNLLSKPQGLLFVTAPVGSGKTTTLYA
ncbi:MAG TPA: ATPase, T2SS/T4P/T4SS family, partial [Polyangiaceae bacterium]|nr:ATPase, T2SS/T4P/T4SS family [Polyangiaceae bacterium]